MRWLSAYGLAALFGTLGLTGMAAVALLLR